MNVLLINPPYPFEETPTPPFGLISLGAYLIENGIDVRIEDYIVIPYSRERAVKTINEYKPDIVGATAVTMNVNKALKILKDYKEANQSVITMMGGPHATFDAENILRDNPYVDFIVRGEGEITLTALLDTIRAGSGLKDVLGISFRQNGKIIHTENRPLIEDINILPIPARHLIPLSKYRALGFSINMITSRGCPHNCIFCVGSRMVGRRVRYFDIDRVVNEFEMLTKLGFKQINVVDDLFTSNKKRCMAICDEIIRRGIVYPWTAFARVDTVSKDLLEKMKKAGCTSLCFGIESGNQEILDTVKKKITLDKCRQAIAVCRETGIEPMASYILGLPGETPDTVRKTLEFAADLCKDYGYHILSPFPGTEVRDKSKEYGLTIFTDDWDRYDANQSVAETEKMPHEEIDRIVGEFNSRINKHVKEVFKKLERGEEIKDKDKYVVESLVTFLVSMDIIINELVESYPGLKDSTDHDNIINDFTMYVEKNTGHKQKDIRSQVADLFKHNALKICAGEDITKIDWV
jgi:anaerobic magnesium-protoporphyrin IX monomethyl ester cyclase